MKRSTFIKKVLLFNASLCLGLNLLSCAEEDLVQNRENIIPENDLGKVREILIANGTIHITSSSTKMHAKSSLKKIRVELDPTDFRSENQRSFALLVQTDLEIIGALILSKGVNLDVLVDKGFSNLFELVTDDIVIHGRSFSFC